VCLDDLSMARCKENVLEQNVALLQRSLSKNHMHCTMLQIRSWRCWEITRRGPLRVQAYTQKILTWTIPNK
jgi:hypothetical protein